MEFLKDVLGEELFGQVSEKLSGAEGVRIANVADGSYIPKEKYDTERGAVRTLKSNIEELKAKIAEMQTATADADGLRSKLAQLQADMASKDAAMKAQELKYLVKGGISKSKARNADIVSRMIDMSKISLDGENLIGLTDQIEALKKSDPYLFEDEPSANGGFDPHQNVGGFVGGTNASVNAAIRQLAGR